MYYIKKKINSSEFEKTIENVVSALKEEGFGVLTEIDMTATLKKKLDVDIRNYRILGACNPPLAHKAVLSEPWIGLMLPCNVVVQEFEDGIEVAAIDPMESMKAVQNNELDEVAGIVRMKLQKVVDSL